MLRTESRGACAWLLLWPTAYNTFYTALRLFHLVWRHFVQCRFFNCINRQCNEHFWRFLSAVLMCEITFYEMAINVYVLIWLMKLVDRGKGLILANYKVFFFLHLLGRLTLLTSEWSRTGKTTETRFSLFVCVRSVYKLRLIAFFFKKSYWSYDSCFWCRNIILLYVLLTIWIHLF